MPSTHTESAWACMPVTLAPGSSGGNKKVAEICSPAKKVKFLVQDKTQGRRGGLGGLP